MSEPGLLIDSDAFVILGASGLLGEAIDTLGFSRSSVYRLGALPHMLQKGKAFAQYAAETRRLALTACESFAQAPGVSNAEVEQSLAAVMGIDAGEAVLFAIMVEQPHYLLTTHDKRALRTLTGTASVSHVRAAVAGRVICLETVLLELIERLGAQPVAEALIPILPNSRELQAVFTPGNAARPGEYINALWAYHRRLEQEVGADLLWRQPK